jgi:hypothetical protein
MKAPCPPVRLHSRASHAPRLALLATLLLLSCVCVPAPDERAPGAIAPALTGAEADAWLRAQMNARWPAPERRLWRIAWHEIKGLPGQAAWHIDGTIWRARLHPEAFRDVNLDRNLAYDVEAVALEQNYGVIELYCYRILPRAAAE